MVSHLYGDGGDASAFSLSVQLLQHRPARVDGRNLLAETIAEGHGEAAGAAAEVQGGSVHGRLPPRLPPSVQSLSWWVWLIR